MAVNRLLLLLTFMVAACGSSPSSSQDAGVGDAALVDAGTGDARGDAALPDRAPGDAWGDTNRADAGDGGGGSDGGGGGDASVPTDAGASGPLCVFPSALIFPAPAVGSPPSTSAFSYGTVSLTNCSDNDLAMQAPVLSGSTDPEIKIDFPPFSGSTTLEPWETVLVELIFTPQTVGSFDGSLEVTYGPTNQVATIPLSATSVDDPGTCLLQLGPTLVSAGSPLSSAMQVAPTAAGDAYNDTFMLVNIGRTSCTVTSIDLTAAGDAFSFPYPGQVATPRTLAFRQLTLINLRFAPSAAGTSDATVSVTGNDGTHTMAVSAQAY